MKISAFLLLTASLMAALSLSSCKKNTSGTNAAEVEVLEKPPANIPGALNDGPHVQRVDYADLQYLSNGSFLYKGPNDTEALPFTGIAEEKHKNGKFSKQYEIENGFFHGETREYYETGKPHTLTTFVNGKRHGPNVYYNPDGTVMKRQKYEQDVVVFSSDESEMPKK
jgi:hypothetical protein